MTATQLDLLELVEHTVRRVRPEVGDDWRACTATDCSYNEHKINDQYYPTQCEKEQALAGRGLGWSWPTVVPGFGVCSCGCSLLHHAAGGPSVKDHLGPCSRCGTCQAADA